MTWMHKIKDYYTKKWFKRGRSHPRLAGAMEGVPVWSESDYGALAREGYQQNVIAYRCVSLIARNLASVSWRLHQGDDPIEDHSLLTLIQSPNPRQTGVSFLESLSAYLLLAGNAYVELVSGADAPELYLLRPDRVQVVPEKGGNHYLYEVGGHRRMIKPSPTSGVLPVLHLKMFHPLNDWYGMSAMEAAASSVDQHNAVGRHNLALLQNGGRPTGALMMKDTGERRIPQGEKESFRQDLKHMFEGVNNAGRIMLLEGDLQWQEMGISPRDLDFVEGKYLSAREIAQAYGVPAMLVGIPGDATFSNYREARFHLWEDTILPLLDKILSEVNRWLCPLYGEGLRFTYDVESIPALVLRREALWARMQACDFLTTNEKRAALGYPPLNEK